MTFCYCVFKVELALEALIRLWITSALKDELCHCSALRTFSCVTWQLVTFCFLLLLLVSVVFWYLAQTIKPGTRKGGPREVMLVFHKHPLMVPNSRWRRYKFITLHYLVPLLLNTMECLILACEFMQTVALNMEKRRHLLSLTWGDCWRSVGVKCSELPELW